jgi:hypothetical protein
VQIHLRRDLHVYRKDQTRVMYSRSAFASHQHFQPWTASCLHEVTRSNSFRKSFRLSPDAMPASLKLARPSRHPRVARARHAGIALRSARIHASFIAVLMRETSSTHRRLSACSSSMIWSCGQ